MYKYKIDFNVYTASRPDIENYINTLIELCNNYEQKVDLYNQIIEFQKSKMLKK